MQDLKKIIPAFLHQFGVLFNDDWEYTKQVLLLDAEEDFFAFYDNWGHHEMLISTYKELLTNNEDENKFFTFIKHFEKVFHNDWDYTRTELYVSRKFTKTFIEEKIENWDAFTQLIQLYQDVVQSDEFIEWELANTKKMLEYVESGLDDEAVIEFEFLTAGSAMVQLFLTRELRQKCMDNNTWKTNFFYKALVHLRNGFDSESFSLENELATLTKKHQPKKNVELKSLDLSSYGLEEFDENLFISMHNGSRFLGLHKYESYVNKIFLIDFKK